MSNAPSPQAVSGVLQTAGGPVFHSVLDMVGHTPMLEVTRLDTGPCRLFLKMESQNPAASIKDRIGISMIEAAERDGRIDPNAGEKPVLVEATAGNTGLGLALVAGQRGYRLIVVVPDKMAKEKIMHLRAMGAEVRTARSDVTKGHPEYYQEVAARIAKETPNSLYINQFANPDNASAHSTTTAPEIAAQIGALGLTVDAFVVGVGSGGTLTGAGGYFKKHNPGCRIILADPAGSILEPLHCRGEHAEPGAWLVEGMGEDFVPEVCDMSLLDDAYAVTDADSFHAGRELLLREGILGGSSTGCLLHAALLWCRKQTEPKTCVTFVCDNGAKYLSKMYNDFWMIDNGFIERERFGDLRDLIARRHSQREDFTLDPNDTLANALKTMKLYDVSQVAIVEPLPDPARTGKRRSRAIGIIDESDVLLALLNEGTSLDSPVSEFMTRRLETIAHNADIKALVPIFRADRVAIVADHADNDRFMGLITRIDMINYLRAQRPTD
jgi:cystathionine beta-synthase